MDFLPLLTLIIAFLSSVLSGMAGVGGGFIMSPYWLLIGMNPAQAVANGSFMAIGMGASSLAAFRKTEHFPRNRRLVIKLMVITAIASILGALVLPGLELESFKVVLAITTIFSLPLLFLNRNEIAQPKSHEMLGTFLFSSLILAGSIIFSSTFSILIAIVLTVFFNLTVLQGTAVRRLIGMVQVAILFSLLALQGNFIWPHALAGITGGIFGSYFGTKFAIKKGEGFARQALAAGALLSSVALLL